MIYYLFIIHHILYILFVICYLLLIIYYYHNLTGLVGKGSNLTIFAINDQLNRYFRKYNRFPRLLYLQIDGGAENANEV